MNQLTNYFHTVSIQVWRYSDRTICMNSDMAHILRKINKVKHLSNDAPFTICIKSHIITLMYPGVVHSWKSWINIYGGQCTLAIENRHTDRQDRSCYLIMPNIWDNQSNRYTSSTSVDRLLTQSKQGWSYRGSIMHGSLCTYHIMLSCCQAVDQRDNRWWFIPNSSGKISQRTMEFPMVQTYTHNFYQKLYVRQECYAFPVSCFAYFMQIC